MSLPLPQHDVVWAEYISWALNLGNLSIIKKVYEKYLKFAPEATDKYINILIEHKDIQGAVDTYIKQASRYEHWMQLWELISKHPDKIVLSNAEKIIRHGIRKYVDEVGRLWICLADYNTRLGNFEKAREIFEEAIAFVVTARDFGLIFDAYMKFEETIIEKDAEYTEIDTEFDDKLDQLIDNTLNTIEERKGEEQLTNMAKDMITEEDEENYKYFKLESLINRRNFLLSNATLRQNPSNVYEWLNRIKLWEFDNDLKIQTFLEALFKVDPMNAYGKASKLWIEFARFYEDHGDIKNSNEIYKRSTKIKFKTIDELATIYWNWAEMHIRHKNYDTALLILHNACSSSRDKNAQRSEREDSLHFWLKLWNFYADLQESIGTFDQAKLVYDRMMDLKVATPQTVLNYCSFLERNYYFEESFRIYERALSLFNWPHWYDLWIIYLSKFIERYADTKIERTRDLFEQALSKCPKDHKKVIRIPIDNSDFALANFF